MIVTGASSAPRQKNRQKLESSLTSVDESLLDGGTKRDTSVVRPLQITKNSITFFFLSVNVFSILMLSSVWMGC